MRMQSIKHYYYYYYLVIDTGSKLTCLLIEGLTLYQFKKKVICIWS